MWVCDQGGPPLSQRRKEEGMVGGTVGGGTGKRGWLQSGCKMNKLINGDKYLHTVVQNQCLLSIYTPFILSSI